MAGLINALKIVDKELTNIKVVLNGSGAAGIAIVKLLHAYGVNNMIMCDSKGAIYSGRNFGMNDTKTYVAKWTNKDKVEGSLEEVIKDADVFIGVSVADILTQDMVKTMADDQLFLLWLILILKSIPMKPNRQVQRLWVQVDLIFQTKLIMY